MALTDLLDLQLAVPDPDALQDFWNRRGLLTTGPGCLGTPERASQLRLIEDDYRHVSELRVACSEESDLRAISTRLEALGLSSTIGDGWLESIDPIFGHRVRVEVGAAAPLAPSTMRAMNRPGVSERIDRRSEAALREDVPAPRRVGHVVFGSPDPARSVEYFVNGLGFKVSDSLPAVQSTFLRCSTDHHSVLIMPAPVPCMNHYALEMDDIDAIGLRGIEIVQERPDASIYGMGRHVVGSNVFWYFLDPAGGMFELFTDMDQIHDDEKWERDVRRDDWDPFTIAAYESGISKMDFFLPVDIDTIAAGRERAGL